MLGDASVSGATWPCYFLPGLPEDNSSSAGVSTSSGMMGSFLYRERLGALLDRYLALLFFQDHAFFLPRPTNDRFHVANVQRDPTIPSSILLAPPVSSSYLDANEGIDLRATGSSSCLSSQLYQTNQMWKGELSELLVGKGY